MKTILLSQILVTALIGLFLAVFNSPHNASSFVFGSLLILFDIILNWLTWKLIFAKKLVALAIGIIVFKYAILGIIVMNVFKLLWLDILWFCLGIASLALAAVIYAIKEAFREEGINNGSI